MVTLLPCPLCGGEALLYAGSGHVGSTHFGVECDRKGHTVKVEAKTEAAAIAGWNTRLGVTSDAA